MSADDLVADLTAQTKSLHLGVFSFFCVLVVLSFFQINACTARHLGLI